MKNFVFSKYEWGKSKPGGFKSFYKKVMARNGRILAKEALGEELKSMEESHSLCDCDSPTCLGCMVNDLIPFWELNAIKMGVEPASGPEGPTLHGGPGRGGRVDVHRGVPGPRVYPGGTDLEANPITPPGVY